MFPTDRRVDGMEQKRENVEWILFIFDERKMFPLSDTDFRLTNEFMFSTRIAMAHRVIPASSTDCIFNGFILISWEIHRLFFFSRRRAYTWTEGSLRSRTPLKRGSQRPCSGSAACIQLVHAHQCTKQHTSVAVLPLHMYSLLVLFFYSIPLRLNTFSHWRWFVA